MDYVTRRLLFAFLILLLVIGCWILVIAHQLDLGALNLAENESLDSILIGAYVAAAISVAIVALAAVSAWLNI